MSRLILISGAGASGKSEYAEKLVTDMHEDRLIYAATMNVYDAESRKKIDIHKKRRAGTDFETIEQPYDIEGIIPYITPKSGSKKSTVLIECMSNLLANEMYGRTAEALEANPAAPEANMAAGLEENPADRIICGIMKLLETDIADIVIVTNEVFADGIKYDDSTMDYIRQLGRINCALAARADMVVEVVCGQPVIWKSMRD